MTKDPMRSTKTVRGGCGLLPIIFLLGALVVFLTGIWILTRPGPNPNRLAIGENAKLASVDLVIRPPFELDYYSKEEVLRLRKEAVAVYSGLIEGDYEPSESVFGQIEDGLPWWGIDGQFYYGNGEMSINGPSEEARFILNPYMLIAAESYGMWDPGIIPEQVIHRSDFTLYCEPSWLRWEPVNRRVELTYDADCVSSVDFRYFDLISYNARDMNMNYIYVSYADSTNIFKHPAPETAYKIPHYIHRGGSCGVQGGCNNMSPPTPEIDALELRGLPAQVVIWLWRDAPESVLSPADLVYVIQFQ
jgi:hypothetical protein